MSRTFGRTDGHMVERTDPVYCELFIALCEIFPAYCELYKPSLTLKPNPFYKLSNNFHANLYVFKPVQYGFAWLRLLRYSDVIIVYSNCEEQPSTSIHYQGKTTIIKTALKHRQEKEAYHLLDRPGQVVLAQLRSAHNRLNAHMHMKLKLVPFPNVSLW